VHACAVVYLEFLFLKFVLNCHYYTNTKFRPWARCTYICQRSVNSAMAKTQKVLDVKLRCACCVSNLQLATVSYSGWGSIHCVLNGPPITADAMTVWNDPVIGMWMSIIVIYSEEFNNYWNGMWMLSQRFDFL